MGVGGPAAAAVRGTRGVGGVLAAAAAGWVVLASVWPGFVSPNEYARVYAARARVLAGSWAIDGELAAHGRIEDVAFANGHFYSNKPPGLVWLAVPVVAAVHTLAPDASPRVDLYAMRLALVTLAALAAGGLLARWVRERGGGGLAPAEASLLLLLATPFGVYAGVLFSHAFAGALLLAAAYLGLGRPTALGERMRLVAAGLAAALAVVSEYPTALLAGAILLAASGRDPKRLAWLALGAAAPLAALLRYNAECFGSPFALSNRFDALPAYGALGRRLLFGIGAPTAEGLAGLFVSPACGLLFLSPFLLPALAAPVRLWRGGERRLATVLGVALWLQPLVLAGYPNWQGGATFGPRYLVCTLPFWGLALCRRPPGRVGGAWLAGAGLAAALVHVAARATPPFSLSEAWSDSLLRGWTLPALAGGLWNRPFGVEARGTVLAVLAALAALQLAVVGAWWCERVRGGRARASALGLAALVLALQLGLGRVGEGQRRWLERAAPHFVLAAGAGRPLSGVGPYQVERSGGGAEAAAARWEATAAAKSSRAPGWSASRSLR